MDGWTHLAMGSGPVLAPPGTTVRVRYLQDVGADQRLVPSVVKLLRLGIVPDQLRLPV
jgi:hypothetical protein